MATRSRTTARFKHAGKVDVFLWGRHIGAVAMDPGYGYYAFAYTPDIQVAGIEPAPLHMPVRRQPYIFPTLPELTYKRLPAMLSDSLPDDFGNALIDRWMAQRGITAPAVTSLDRLAYMSNRGMGALTFKPSHGPAAAAPTVIELSSLVAEARRALSGRLDGDDDANEAMRHIIAVGTSAGGARAKAVIAINPDTNEIRSGHLDVPEGFEHWLLKFDGMGADRELGQPQGYGRIEYAYHLMARAARITMSNCRLLEENGRAHFMTKRFDRTGNARHHMQTLCAMAHLDYKLRGAHGYVQLFQTIRQLGLPYEAMEDAFRRMVFNVMGRNCDDHTKNISFLLREGSQWELAPAYDVTFAHNPAGDWTYQHLMSVNGKFSGIQLEDCLAEVERFSLGTARRVVDEVRKVFARWSEFAAEAGLSDEQAATIRDQFVLLKG